MSIFAALAAVPPPVGLEGAVWSAVSNASPGGGSGLFPYLPKRPGYNKRLRAATMMMRHVTAALTRRCASFYDDVWLVDYTPVECGRSRRTTKCSDLAGWATYGYCASHSRWFSGLRLHIIATPNGLPIAFVLTGAKDNERDIAADMISIDPNLHRPGQTLIADTGYRSAAFEAHLERHGGRKPQGVAARRPQTPPRPHRSDLAQPNHQPARTNAQPHRLRPPTHWN